MKRLWLLAGVLILGVVGCRADQKRIAMPNLAQPGSACVQEKRALRFYPYAEPNVGPGMADTRPREYEVPPAEVSRGRWQHSNEAMFPNQQRWNTDGLELSSPPRCPVVPPTTPVPGT